MTDKPPVKALLYLPSSPTGDVLGPDRRSGDGPLSNDSRVLVRYRQLHLPVQLPFLGVRDPLPSFWNHPLPVHLSSGAGGQLLHPAHRRPTRKTFKAKMHHRLLELRL